MNTYTVSVYGSGDLLKRFEQVLDLMPAGAIVGDEEQGATLMFDVVASDLDTAIEFAWLRTVGIVRLDDAVVLTVSPSEPEPPRSWWKRLLGR